MAVSEITGVGNGSARSWTIPFPYIHKSHVKMTVDGAPVDISVSGSEVTLAAEEPTPTSENDYRIYRETPRESLATYLPVTLNDTETNRLGNLQSIYIVQEVQDALDKLQTPGNVLLSEFMEDFLQVASEDAGLSYLGLSTFMRGLKGAANTSALVDLLGKATLQTLLDVGPFPPMFIKGSTYARNATDTANDIDFAAGSCLSDDGTAWINLIACTKQLDVASADDNAAAASGMLDTGAVANNDFWLFGIKNPTTGASRHLASLSRTAPTMPAGYTKKRLIGWVRRSGGTIVDFRTSELSGGGLSFEWKTPTLDVSTSLGTTTRTDTIKVPVGISVRAHVAVSTGGVANYIIGQIWNPDAAAPATYNIGTTANNGWYHGADLWLWTSTNGQLSAACNYNTSQYYVSTLGFELQRR